MITFGPFQLDAKRRVLTRGSNAVPLEGRPLDILICLAQHHGRIVGKEDLLTAVWPGRVMTDNNLAVHISALRRFLGQTPEGRPFIQTVPGRGYLLRTDPTPFPAAAGPGPDAPAPAPPRPRHGNSFVGRVKERAALAELVGQPGLVTLAGTGGIGKTRLALLVARELVPGFADGVHLAELAGVTDGARATEQVGRLFPLGAHAEPDTRQIARFLRDCRLLLLLDNCEHLLDTVAPLAAAILAQCPGVSILATSREPLGVPGEHVFRLHPLALPAPAEETTMAEALRSDAVQLFLARAADAIPEFRMDEDSLGAVVSVCTRLDGVPLAIEMAVPRLRVLAPAKLADWLRDGLDVLGTPDRTVPPRQRTLRAVLDWSFALLLPGEQGLLSRLSLFGETADIEAVIAVAGPVGAPRADVLDQLAALIDKSLVETEAGPDGPRYRLLSTVREYAGQHLPPDDRRAMRHRHAQHYTAVFAALAGRWPWEQSEDWKARVALEAAELRAALSWCFGADGDVELGLRLLAATVNAWWELPGLPLREGRSWFDRAVALIGPGTPPEVAAWLFLGVSWRDMRHNDVENLPAAERSVALFRTSGDRTGLAAALTRAGSAVLTRQPSEQVAATLGEAEALLRQDTPGKWLALCLIRLGDLHSRTGAMEASLAAYTEGLAIATQSGHVYGMTNGGSNMADLLFLLGRPEAALAQLRQLHRALPPGFRAPLTSTLAAHLVLDGAQGETLDAVAEVLGVAPAIGYRGAAARSIETLALLLSPADPAAAARLAGFAQAVLPGHIRWAASRTVLDQLHGTLAGTLPAEQVAALLGQGAAWNEATGVQMAEAALRRLRASAATAS